MGAPPQGFYAAASEVSKGKDTPSGHWEMAGVPVPWEWHVFPNETPCFPKDLTDLAAKLAGCEGILGNRHASGTAIIDDLGAEHLRTGWPICYTSVDSVFQIAAHEEAFGLERLIALCEDLAPHLHAMRVGRVIARPFTGNVGAFERTPNRRDFAIDPPQRPCWIGRMRRGGQPMRSARSGIFSRIAGVGKLWKGKSDADLLEHLVRLGGEAEEGSLTFANFVEFDSLYGHRRDVSGYARALEWFDAGVGRFFGDAWP